MKNRNSLILTAASLALMMVTSSAQIYINEVRIDQTGTDNDEYFELFGTPDTSLDDLTYLVLGDGAGVSGVIESVTPLLGYSLNSSGFFVGAEGTFTLGVADGTFSLNFENSDNVTHVLVSGFTGSDGDDLDTNDDGILDVTPWTGVTDAVALIEEPNPPSATEYAYGAALGGSDVGPDGSFVPGQIYRYPDGGPWQIGQFDPSLGTDSPGAANVPEPATTALILGALGLGFVLYRRRRA